MAQKKDNEKIIIEPEQRVDIYPVVPITTTKPDPFIVLGYRAAITLAFLGIILSSIYLFIFIGKSNPTEIKLATAAAYNTERKTVELSTAIFVAMSFGFLGFGLFLINAKGDVDGKANLGEHIQVSFTKLSPGLFVILCATVIIIFAITHDIEYKETYKVGNQNQGTKLDSIPPDSNVPVYQRHPQTNPPVKSPKKH